MKTVLLTIVIVVVALIALILIIGALLPKHHNVTRTEHIDKPVDEVYRTVRDFKAYPSWRKDIKSIDMLGAVDGKERFRENRNDGSVTYEAMEDAPGQRIVTRIVDVDLGYSGAWTYSFKPDASGADSANGTTISITEDADVTNIFFRFMSRFVFGHTTTIDKYLSDLGNHFSSGKP